MDITLGGLRPLLDSLYWPSDPSSRFALLALASIALLAGVLLYLPFVWRWIGIARLDRRLRRAARRHSNSPEVQRQELATLFQRSPVEFQWTEFHRRWSRVQGPAALKGVPVRFATTLQQWPLLPRGMRRTALDAVPGLLVATSIFGAIFVLSISLGRPEAPIGQAALLNLVAVALRAPLWGLALAIFAGVAGRLIQGTFDHYSESLDQLVSRAFMPLPHGDSPSLEEARRKNSLTADTRGQTGIADTTASVEAASRLISRVSQQVSALLDQLSQAGSALRDTASVMQSSQDITKSSSAEMRVSLEQAASSMMDQRERIEAGLAEFPPTLAQFDERAEEDPPPASRDARPTREAEAGSSPMASTPRSGRWLGPDPYARQGAGADFDLDRAERLLDAHGLGPQPVPTRPVDRTSSLVEASRGLSSLLTRPRPRLKKLLAEPSDSAHRAVEPSERTELESSPGIAPSSGSE